jgi:hypothetical protein
MGSCHQGGLRETGPFWEGLGSFLPGSGGKRFKDVGIPEGTVEMEGREEDCQVQKEP